MPYCCLCKKKQYAGSGSFFRAPREEEKRRRWSEICGKDIKKSYLVCMDHFSPSTIVKTSRCPLLLPTAEPVLNLSTLAPNNNKETKSNNFNQNVFMELETTEGEPPTSNLLSVPEPCLSISSVPQVGMEEQKENPQVCMEVESQNQYLMGNYLKMVQHHNLPIVSNPEKKGDTIFKNQGTQTDPVLLEYTVERQGYLDKVRKLESKIKDLECMLSQANKAVDSMRNIFTDGQIRKLMSPGDINWKWADISSAICLHAAGPRAYNHLYKKGYPLPHVSTLQRWCRKIDIKEGVLNAAIDFMSHIEDLDAEEKICVLAFDEMKVMETYEYEAVDDFVREPKSYVQVVMARGLRKSWKQPIYFGYDSEMTKEILEELIVKLSKIGFPVVAVVCDLGPSNCKLRRQLAITPEKPWFCNPSNKDDKIFFIADAPHLLKLVRNHFVDSGLIVNNKLLTTRTIEELLNYTSGSDVSITHKLSSEHLTTKGPGRQKVKLAAQLFSNTTANAIRRCHSIGLELYNAVDTADFIQLINDWFDILNSSLSSFNLPGKEPFGLQLEKQEETLSKLNQIMSSRIVPNRNVLPFQEGILITNNALVNLYKYVSEKYNMKYICTSRINQDVLEHFFGAIRSKGGLNDHPSPKEFRYRTRKYILARNTEHLQGTGNVKCDGTEWLAHSNMDLSASIYQKSPNLHEMVEEEIEPNEMADLREEDFDDRGILEDDAIEYISGYLIRKLKLPEYESHENSFTWVDQVSKGYLKKPETGFVNKIKSLENIFNNINKNEICPKPKLHHRLLQNSKSIQLPDKIKAFYFKCRIHFRVRQLNRRKKVQKAKERIMGFKKMIKIKL